MSCQRSRCAVIGRPAVQTRKYIYLEYNTINSKYYMKYHLKPSRIQVKNKMIDTLDPRLRGNDDKNKKSVRHPCAGIRMIAKG